MPKNKKSKENIIGAYFATTISITMVLFIVGLISLLIINSIQLSKYAKSNVDITIFLSDEAKPADIDRLQKDLKIAPYSSSVKFVSKQKASQIMKEELGKDFTKSLGYNSLPNSIEVKLNPNYTSEDSIVSIKKRLQNFTYIKEIFYQKHVVSLLNENITKLSFIGGIIAMLLFIISISLINNAIRLSIYSKRFLIRTAELVGATRNFIRKPFVIKGILSGLLSASLSALALVFLMLILQSNFENIIIIKGVVISIIIIFIFGIIISGISSYLSVNKYLDMRKDKLYFE